MLINITASKLISQSGEVAGQVLGLVSVERVGVGWCPGSLQGREFNFVSSSKVNKPRGFD